MDSAVKKNTIFVGDTNATYSLVDSLYAFDPSGPMSQVSYLIDPNANQPSYLERNGIDLDELGVDLPGYKVCQSVFPEGRFSPDVSPLTFVFGAADYFNQTATVGLPMTYDGSTNYKLDFGIAGRYLDMQITGGTDFGFFTLSGFDFDLDVFGER